MNRDDVEQWVGRYTTAWDSNDPRDIRAAFTQDVEYRFTPHRDPVHGHEALIAAWLDGRDGPGDHAFAWEVEAIDGATAVIRGRTEYLAGVQAGAVYDNLWIVRLTADGRASAFTEWWMEQPR